MYSRLHTWSRGLYLAGIVLALVLVIPTAWFPFQLAKVAVFAVLLLGAAVLFVAIEMMNIGLGRVLPTADTTMTIETRVLLFNENATL